MIKNEADSEVNDLKYTLKQYHKDKISLSNLKIKLSNFSEKLERIIKDKEDLELKYEDILRSINELKENYEEDIKFTFKNVNAPNEDLKQEIDNYVNFFKEKEEELNSIIVG